MNHFGMELYLPTINKEFMEFITNLPIRWVNGGTTFHRLTNSLSVNRRFHKKALSRYLKQEEIYNRSFDVPWYNILRPRKELLIKLKERLIKRGWYKKDTLDQMFAEFLEQKVKDYELLELKHHGYRIFTLLSLEIWCIEYLDGRKTKNFDEKITLEDYLS
jgi:asparagine synthase (glutamine-hydrolysing)